MKNGVEPISLLKYWLRLDDVGGISTDPVSPKTHQAMRRPVVVGIVDKLAILQINMCRSCGLLGETVAMVSGEEMDSISRDVRLERKIPHTRPYVVAPCCGFCSGGLARSVPGNGMAKQSET